MMPTLYTHTSVCTHLYTIRKSLNNKGNGREKKSYENVPTKTTNVTPFDNGINTSPMFSDGRLTDLPLDSAMVHSCGSTVYKRPS